MYYNTTAMARFEGQSALRGPSQLCSLHFSVHRNTWVFFRSDYVAPPTPLHRLNNFNRMMVIFLINHRITTV